jgi:hypothetical protein
MPVSLNYGSTGRPPGKFHLRHSFKEITDNLEFPSPPFDILFIEMNANNNNYNNGDDIAAAAAAAAAINDYYDKGGVLHGTRTRRMKNEEANDGRRIPYYTINPSKFASWKLTGLQL